MSATHKIPSLENCAASEQSCLTRAVSKARTLHFQPRQTVACRGEPLFRTQLARDLGCLLDVDPNVGSWRCLPRAISIGAADRAALFHVPDFEVQRADGAVYMDAVPASAVGQIDWNDISRGCSRLGLVHECVPKACIMREPKLSNTKDLLRYARTPVSLGDRVRLLAFLEENGATPLAECATAIRDARDPIAVVAALAVRRFVFIDLEDAPIGPDTPIRCVRQR